MGESHSVFVLEACFALGRDGASVDVNADDALMWELDVLVALIAKIHDGLLFVAWAIGAVTLHTGRDAGEFRLDFDMCQDGGHVDTSRRTGARGFPSRRVARSYKTKNLLDRPVRFLGDFAHCSLWRALISAGWRRW